MHLVADLEKIITYAEDPKITRATVVGGGLLGLEAAKAVYDLPTIPDVSIINRQGYPLSRQLDQEAGTMVLRRIEDMGVKCLTNVNVSSMLTEPCPEDPGMDVFKGFEFTDGECLEADLVIMAVGITPRDDLARASGIKCHARGGIDVGDDLMTSAKDVYAMGECASWKGNTYGLIGPGGQLFGQNLVDRYRALTVASFISGNGRHLGFQSLSDADGSRIIPTEKNERARPFDQTQADGS